MGPNRKQKAETKNHRTCGDNCAALTSDTVQVPGRGTKDEIEKSKIDQTASIFILYVKVVHIPHRDVVNGKDPPAGGRR